MRRKIKKLQNEISLPIKTILGLIISSTVGVLTTVFISFLFSIILSNSAEISKYIGIYFIFSVIIGGMICGFCCTKFLCFKGIISGLISSISFSIFIFTIMLFNSDGSLNIYSLILLIIIIVSTTTGGIVSANTKRRK